MLMRRLTTGSVLILALAAVALIAAPSALGQTELPVTLRLLSQTVWTGSDRPLDLAVTATNGSGADLDDLTVELIIMAPARSRSLYELSIREDPTPVLIGYPFADQGSLPAGETRTFEVRQPMDLLANRNESALYPLRVELRSRDVVVGALRSPMIFLIEHPLVPLNLAWTWDLSEPIQYGPDGVFRPGPLEADIAPEGRLDVMARSLARLRSTPADVVVSAALADQLGRMAGGYRIEDAGGTVRTVPKGSAGAADAARLLDLLSTIAGRATTELVGSPLGDPSLPALARSGLIGDLDTLAQRGADLIRATVGRTPQDFVIRPSASQLDAQTLPAVVARGAGTLLVDTNFLPTEKFATPPTVQLTAGRSAATAILPEPEITSLAATSAADPRLAAQIALGELAAMWLELPGTPGRGAALMLPPTAALPTEFLRVFSTLVKRSPWLEPLPATRFVHAVPAVTRRPIGSRRFASFDPTFAARLIRAKGAVSQFQETAPDARVVAERLHTKLLLAESGSFVGDPRAGGTFIDSVDRAIARTYSRIDIATSVVTLTSQSGFIPLTLVNRSGYDVRVVLQFVADRRLQFAGGPARIIDLPGPNRTLTIGVRALTTGRIPIKVQLLTSGDRPLRATIAESGLIIRSTAYNRVALIITIGAALFLMIWWGRRFLPRRSR